MTTNLTATRSASTNVGNLACAGKTTEERNPVVRPSARKRRLWSRKPLSVMGFAAALMLFTPSCATSGSDMPKEQYEGNVRPLQASTVAALKQDTGIDPLFVLAFSADGPIVVGRPPNAKITRFNNEQELWAKAGKITIESVLPTAFIRYRSSPVKICWWEAQAGSLVLECATFDF